MKNLLFATLLILPCVSISQTTDQLAPLLNQKRDSLKLAPQQVKNVYTGLKEGEAYRQLYTECLAAAGTLNNIIQDINADLRIAMSEADKLNAQIKAKNSDLTAKEVEIQALKDKKTPWYRHPITIAIIAFSAGVYIAK